MHPCFTSIGQLFNIAKYLAWILCNFRHMPCKFHQHQQHRPTQHAPNLHNCDSCLRIIPGIFHRVSIMEQGVQIYMHMYPIWSVCVGVHMCMCEGKTWLGLCSNYRASYWTPNGFRLQTLAAGSTTHGHESADRSLRMALEIPTAATTTTGEQLR